MSHRQTQLQLSDYLDGEIAAGERLRLERHVEECASCARELSGLRQVRGLLRDLPTPEPPPRLAEAVMARLHEEEIRLGPWARLAAWWQEAAAVSWPVPIAAAAMGAVAFAVLTGGETPLDPSPARPAPALVAEVPAQPLDAGPLVLASEGAPARERALAAARPASGTAQVRTGSSPIDACLRSGRSPQQCLRLPAYMVGLAVSDPDAFLAQVETLPQEKREAWIEELAAFAQQSGSAPILARQLRSGSHPSGPGVALVFERRPAPER